MEKDPSIKVVAEFGCRNRPVDDPELKKMFKNKPVVESYKAVKSSYYDNLKLEKHDFLESLEKIVFDKRNRDLYETIFRN